MSSGMLAGGDSLRGRGNIGSKESHRRSTSQFKDTDKTNDQI